MLADTDLPLGWAVPAVEPHDVAACLETHWGLRGRLSPLPGERDRNFRLIADGAAPGRDRGPPSPGEPADETGFVVKVMNAAEPDSLLELQHAALACVARQDPDLVLPAVVRTADNRDSADLRTPAGERHAVRVLTWLAGAPLARAGRRTRDRLESLGRWLGRFDKALAGFDHPAAHRAFKWDLARAGWIVPHFERLTDTRRRALAERLFQPFLDSALPRLAELPQSVIHNDANDHNVICAPPGAADAIAAVVDYGDMIRTATVSEPAIAAAYAMLDTPVPLDAAAAVVAGYHAAHPVSEAEIAVLYPLICARLVVSVVNSALQRELEPDNDYLTVSEAPAWALLERIADVHPRLAEYRLRAACGLPACPAGERLRRWTERHAPRFRPLVHAPPDSPLPRIDLSAETLLLADPAGAVDDARLTDRIEQFLAAERASAGFGAYDEARLLYLRDTFRGEGLDGPEWRTVHLGLDVFAPPGTPVHAPLAGRVHSVRNHTAPLDYGPTVVLEHQAEDDDGTFTFHSLVGHLDPAVLERLRPGQRIEAGEAIGRIGGRDINGGWAPHVHLQLIADLAAIGDSVPGVAGPAERALWLSLCPSPYAFSGLTLEPPAPVPSTGALLHERAHRLGPNLSVAYRRPLHIVRGWKQWLYDADAQPYLDAVNNVAHVGHQHPRVTEAARRQHALLDTNTRYLHRTILAYAARLTATLPDPLRVCFFVNSGSEANELALRLAWTHTGRTGTLVLDGAYHGNTTTLIGLSPYKAEGPGGRRLLPNARKLPLPDRYRGCYRGDDPDLGARYAAHVDDAINSLAQAGMPVGAFLCESMPSCGGQIVLPPGYLADVYRRVREAGVVIADEVQTGFGRVGSHFWAFETQNVVPDIVVMGKPAGNGHPLGVVVTTPAIAASFANGMEFFSTFGGNPVACAVGLAVLDVIEDEGLQRNARETGAVLLDGLRELTRRHPAAGDARGLGLFAGLEIVRDPDSRTPDAALARHIVERLRSSNILVSTDGPDHNVIKIKPPLCFGVADAERLVAAIDAALGEARAG